MRSRQSPFEKDSYYIVFQPLSTWLSYLFERHGRHLLRPVAALVVMNRTLSFRTICLVRRTRIHRYGVALLRAAIHVLVVPHLAQHSVAVISRTFAFSGSIETRARAPDEGNTAMLLGKRLLEVGVRVGGRVGRDNILCLQPLVGGEALVVLDCSFEEVDYLFVLAVQRAVAWRVEGAVAGGVLAKLMAPETRVILILSDPVRVHVFQEIVAAEGLQKGANVGPFIGRHNSAVLEAICRVGRWDRVVLTGQVTILGVTAIAEIRPTEVCKCQCPRIKN